MKFELKGPYQHYTDAELIDDIRRVASITGKSTVVKSEYELHGRFSYPNTAKRFGSWVQALERAGLSTGHAKAATAESLKEDLRRVATALGRDYVTIPEYCEHGRWSESPFFRVFGNWSKAQTAAGLGRHPSAHPRASDEELLSNLERVWIALGRQPKYTEIKAKGRLSRFSANTYLSRFGTWRKALEAFVVWVQSEGPANVRRTGHRFAEVTGTQCRRPRDIRKAEETHAQGRESAAGVSRYAARQLYLPRVWPKSIAPPRPSS